jgi:gamma-glutamyltranspeptidase
VNGRDALVRALEARGHQIRQSDMTSGLHGIIRICASGSDRSESLPCQWESGTDPRREGRAAGR